MPGMPRHAPDLVAHGIGKRDRLVAGHHGELRGGPERAVGLGPVDPDALVRPGGSTPSPTASMTPAPSLCGITRGYGSPYPTQSPRFFVSPGLTPESATRTRTSPGPAQASAISPTVQHLRRGARPLVPSCQHPPHARPPRRHPAGPSRFEARLSQQSPSDTVRRAVLGRPGVSARIAKQWRPRRHRRNSQRRAPPLRLLSSDPFTRQPQAIARAAGRGGNPARVVSTPMLCLCLRPTGRPPRGCSRPLSEPPAG